MYSFNVLWAYFKNTRSLWHALFSLYKRVRVCKDLNALVPVCLHQVCLIINGIQSLHLLTNTRTPAKQHCVSLCLSFSVSLSLSSCSRLINSSPYRFVSNLFFSGFLCGLDFRQNVRYWWTHSEGAGCGVFCISLFWFQRSYLIFVYRNNVDSCATAGWLLAPPWTHPGSATGPDQHCQMPSGSAGVANQRHRKWIQLLTNSKPLFEFMFLWWLWGVYWPRADSVRLVRVPAGPLDWCPSLTVFRSDTHLIKQLQARSTNQRSRCYQGNHMCVNLQKCQCIKK